MRIAPAVVMPVLLAACGSTNDGVPAISGGEVTLETGWMSMSAEVHVLVVDDATTSWAETLRAAVADNVQQSLAVDVEEYWHGSCGNPDPAAWHTADVQFVVIRPSAPDEEAMVTALTLPELRQATRAFAAPQAEELALAVRHALLSRLALPGEVYRPLRAAKRVEELLAGLRQPETSVETALVASLPKDYLAQIFVASTRDDADPTPVADLEFPTRDPWPGTYLVWVSAFGPAMMHGAKSRLSQWGGDVFEPWTGSFPSDMFAAWGADCVGHCFEREVAIPSDGEAACRATVELAPEQACDPSRGWHDPRGQPTFVEHYGGTYRLCEVSQLAGADLESCRHSVDCPNCPSGWCVSEVPELLCPCSAPRVEFPLRFVGGAAGGQMEIRCLTAP